MKRILSFILVILILFPTIVTAEAQEMLEYDLLGLMTGKSYDENPVLYSDIEIAEFVLYQFYRNDESEVRFRTPAAFKKPKIDYEFIAVYFPHYFSLSYTYSNINEAKKNGFTQWEIKPTIIYPDIIPQERAMAEEAANKLTGDDDTAVLKAIHDYVADIAKYDMDGFKKNKYACEHDGQTAYCILEENMAVCAGYANAVSLIAQFAGLNVAYYSGKAGGAHAWNVVYSPDNIYKVIDATWDDNDVGAADYDFFMKTYSEINSMKKNKRKWNSNIDSFVNYINNRKEGDSDNYLVYGSDEQGGKTDFAIDMMTETIRFGNDAANYVVSVDGGVKWKLLKSLSVSSLLNKKEVNLVIAKTSDGKIPVDGTKISFGKIAARPKMTVKGSIKDGKFILSDTESFVYIASDYKAITFYDYLAFPVAGIAVTPVKVKIKAAVAPVVDGETVIPRSKLKTFTIKP